MNIKLATAIPILAFFGIIALIAPANPAFAVKSAGGGEIDGEPVRPLQTEDVPVNCDVDTGDIVALETSNGGTWDDHTFLKADLEALGFTVRTFSISDGIPDCVVKIFITSGELEFCVEGSYTSSEVDLIKSAVENGKALHLQNEHTDCGEGTDAVAEAFGVTPNDDYKFDDVDGPVIFAEGANYFLGSPPILFDGVDTWQEDAADIYTTGSGVVVRSDADEAVMIAKKVQKGCVVIVGDYNWSQDPGLNTINISNEDNRQLATNVFLFLNACMGPPVGGEILHIDTVSLFIAGAFTNAYWILAVLGGIAGAVIALIRTARRS